MGIKVTNNAYGTLSASITSSGTTIALATGQGARFPSLGAGDYFYGTLIDTSNNVEIVKVTARSSDSMTVVRAQDNTTARAYSTNDRFELRPTAALFDDLVARIAEKLALAGGTMSGDLAISKTTPKLTLGETGVSDAYLQYANNGGTGKLTLGMDSGGGEFVIRSYSGGYAERFKMTTAGIITTPNQPLVIVGALGVSRSSGTYKHWGTSGYVWTNEGGYWNASTGRFTAPATGRYLVNATIRMSSESSTAYNYMQFINSNNSQTGTPIHLWSPANDGGTYRPHTLTAIMKLNQNDTLDPTLYLNAAAVLDGGSTGQTDDGLQITFLG